MLLVVYNITRSNIAVGVMSAKHLSQFLNRESSQCQPLSSTMSWYSHVYIAIMICRYRGCFLLLLFCCSPIRIGSVKSGIFVDNGIDQTVMSSEITEDEKRELEENLLDFLGLPKYSKTSSKIADLRKPASKFLMDIYKSWMIEEEDDSKRKKRELTALTRDEQDAIQISDLIMTFENEGKSLHLNEFSLWFALLLCVKVVTYNSCLFTAKFLEMLLLVYNECKFNKPVRECIVALRSGILVSGFLLVISMIFKGASGRR